MQCSAEQVVLLVLLQLISFTSPQSEQEVSFIRIAPPGGIQSLQGPHQKLRCDASHHGESVELDWFLNDRRILDTNQRFNIDESSNRMDTASFSILTIKNTRVADSGRYSCRMRPPGREVATATVSIYERPVVVGSPGQLQVPDENVTLTCMTLPDLTEYGAKIFWHKEGRFIGTKGLIDVDGDQAPDVTIQPNGNLTIMSSQAVFGGTYTCRVRYMMYGTTRYVSSDVQVFVNTSVRTEPYNWYNANARRPLRLRCVVEGFPYASIGWSYNGVPIRPGDMPRNVSLLTKPLDHVTMLSTLTIRELPGNFNVTQYTCTGHNQFGTDQKVASVVNTEQVFRPFGSKAAELKPPALICCLALLLGALLQNAA